MLAPYSPRSAAGLSVFTQSVFSVFPSLLLFPLKPKSLVLHRWWGWWWRGGWWWRVVVRLLPDSPLVSFVFVVTYDDPKLVPRCAAAASASDALCFCTFKAARRSYCKSFACHSTIAVAAPWQYNQYHVWPASLQKPSKICRKQQVGAFFFPFFERKWKQRN